MFADINDIRIIYCSIENMPVLSNAWRFQPRPVSQKRWTLIRSWSFRFISQASRSDRSRIVLNSCNAFKFLQCVQVLSFLYYPPKLLFSYFTVYFYQHIFIFLKRIILFLCSPGMRNVRWSVNFRIRFAYYHTIAFLCQRVDVFTNISQSLNHFRRELFVPKLQYFLSFNYIEVL